MKIAIIFNLFIIAFFATQLKATQLKETICETIVDNRPGSTQSQHTDWKVADLLVLNSARAQAGKVSYYNNFSQNTFVSYYQMYIKRSKSYIDSINDLVYGISLVNENQNTDIFLESSQLMTFSIKISQMIEKLNSNLINEENKKNIPLFEKAQDALKKLINKSLLELMAFDLEIEKENNTKGNQRTVSELIEMLNQRMNILKKISENKDSENLLELEFKITNIQMSALQFLEVKKLNDKTISQLREYFTGQSGSGTDTHNNNIDILNSDEPKLLELFYFSLQIAIDLATPHGIRVPFQ